MNPFEISIIILLVVILGLLICFAFIKTKPKHNNKEILEVRIEEFTKQLQKYESELKHKETLLEEKKEKIRKLETKLETESKEKDHQLKEKDRKLSEDIHKLALSQEKFSDEQERVREAEKKAKEEIEKNKDRIWNEHEDKSLQYMKNICDKNKFRYYTNTDLPQNFPKGIKPDFMTPIMGQYIIFDPKFSKNKNLSSYIQNQVKSTNIKYESHKDIIFHFIFFIIPSMSIVEVKETCFHRENYSFFIITVEAVEPILRVLKKLEDYELAKEINPEDRDKIIRSIASLSRQIKEQNAINLLGTGYGIKTLHELNSLPKDIATEVKNVESNTVMEKFNLNEMKELRNSETKQKERFLSFIENKEPDVKLEDVKNVEKKRKKS